MKPSEVIICPVCTKQMRSITTQHIRAHGFSSAHEFKSCFALETLKCETMRDAQSAFLTRTNPTTSGHRQESIEKMRRNRRGKGLGVAGKYIRTEAIRQKIAEGVLRAWAEGRRGRGWYVYGQKAYGKVWVRSSWEERVCRLLDAHPGVLSYEVEPFQISYEWQGRRRYTPDFLVVLEGNITELWEVKPRELLEESRNLAKIRALNDFVARRNWNSRLVTLADIEGMERRMAVQAAMREF